MLQICTFAVQAITSNIHKQHTYNVQMHLYECKAVQYVQYVTSCVHTRVRITRVLRIDLSVIMNYNIYYIKGERIW